MTDSGYPRTVREWARGTPLSSAKLVYEGKKEDVAAHGYAYLDRGHSYEWRQRAITFWTTEHLASRAAGQPLCTPRRPSTA